MNLPNDTRRALNRSAGVLLILACALGGAVGVEAWKARHDDPLTHPEFVTLMAQVAERPAEMALRERLRVIDHELRSIYFDRADRIRRGAWAIAGLGGLALGCIALARLGRGQVYDPRKVTPPDPWRGAAWARLGVLGSGVLAAGGLGLLAWAGSAIAPQVSQATAAEPGAAPPAPTFPSAEEFARNWPSWRGPTGCGVTATAWPTEFDLAAGTNVVWKVPCGLPGVSSPIVWDSSVYLTGGDEAKQTITAFDATTGAVRWTAEAPWPQGPKPEVYADTGFAAPTPVTDGKQVVAIFASGALVAVNCADGKLRWQKQLGLPESQYSYSASLAIWQDRVFVQWDVDTADKSALICFQIGTGKELWRTKRKVGASWGSPIVATIQGKPTILTSGNPLVNAYDPATGAELWTADLLGGDVGPSPIAVGDLAMVANVRCELAAIKPGGSGDITKTHKLWKGEDGLPDMVSPASDGTLVALFSDSGMMTTYRVADGSKAYEEDLSSGFKGSPIIHGNDLLIFSTDGKAIQVRLGDTFEKTFLIETGAEVAASPAVVGGRMYLRTADDLVCIGAKP